MSALCSFSFSFDDCTTIKSKHAAMKAKKNPIVVIIVAGLLDVDKAIQFFF